METAEKPQHLASLELANRVRLLRAPAKRSVAALPPWFGRLLVAELLLDTPDWLDGEQVGRVLRWPKRVDRKISEKWLRTVSFNGGDSLVVAPVRNLTQRQREALAALLRGRT